MIKAIIKKVSVVGLCVGIQLPSISDTMYVEIMIFIHLSHNSLQGAFNLKITFFYAYVPLLAIIFFNSLALIRPTILLSEVCVFLGLKLPSFNI